MNVLIDDVVRACLSQWEGDVYLGLDSQPRRAAATPLGASDTCPGNSPRSTPRSPDPPPQEMTTAFHTGLRHSSLLKTSRGKPVRMVRGMECSLVQTSCTKERSRCQLRIRACKEALEIQSSVLGGGARSSCPALFADMNVGDRAAARRTVEVHTTRVVCTERARLTPRPFPERRHMAPLREH